MNISIFINNSGISNVDCSNPLKGNPGIGGTEYCILLLAQTYKSFYPDNRVCLIVSTRGKLPVVDDIVVCDDLLKVPTAAQEQNADILLISSLYNGSPLPPTFFEEVNRAKIRTITWGHNYYLSDYCNRVSSCQWVKANVFVGRQQYDRYIDHRIIRKSTYIYNIYPTEGKHYRSEIDKPVVTYIGSLVPMKGFHVLADAWKRIIDKIPDAELQVVGTGKLYSRSAKLGQYGIADEAYEKRIMPGLTDCEGRILPSVHFWGVLGTEKDSAILRTSVGVVNPTGRTETFGLSALDFESMGVPVVTIAKGGFLDTVVDGKTGILVNKSEDIAEAIIGLLIDKKRNKEFGQCGIDFSKHFSPDQIITEWHDLLCGIVENKTIKYKKPNSFILKNLKWLRIANRAIHNPVSVITLETSARILLRRLGK